MVQSILRNAGLKVGLYTSPHLVSFNERIRVNGTQVSNNFIIDFMKKFNDDIDEIKSTFFETTTVLALYYFNYKKVDVAVIETGLGGRLDSTNVLDTDLTIITPIDIDHQNILGHTIKEIASEKAGIIKKNTPVISSHQHKEVMKILSNRAKSINTKIIISQKPEKITIDYFSTRFNVNNKSYSIPLLGEHQADNAALAIQAVRIFKPKLNYNIISDGLINTVWPGRFHLLDKKLPIFYDVAHNQAGINSIRNTLKYLNVHKKVGLIILKEDKDIDNIAHSLNGLFNELIVSTIPDSQLMGIKKLFNYLNENNIKCKTVNPIEEAFKYMTNQAENGAISIIFGSHYAAKSIYKFFEINFDNVTI